MGHFDFSLGDMRGRVVAAAQTQNFTCEVVMIKNAPHDTMICVVTHGKKRLDTAMLFPVDGYVAHPDLYAKSVCQFYEDFRSSIWSDLYKGG